MKTFQFITGLLLIGADVFGLYKGYTQQGLDMAIILGFLLLLFMAGLLIRSSRRKTILRY